MTATNRPWLLDLFCGAGGAAMGYHRAGFKVTGVDIAPQPRYPFTFIQGDVFTVLEELDLTEFSVIHASPPCQRYSVLRRANPTTAEETVPPTRDALQGTGKPWVIENVVGAPLRSPIMLCGRMFGLRVKRHRLFESSEDLAVPEHQCWPRQADNRHDPAGYASLPFVPYTNYHKKEFRAALTTEWMTCEESRQAIPPAYTEWIGARLLSTCCD